MSEPEVTYTVANLDIWDRAREEIRVAREQGVDPRKLAETHAALSLVLENLIRQGEEQ